MKKSLFLFGCLFCILPLWATQIYLPAYQNVVELHSGDTVRLDTAGTYRFFQTVDTLYDVLILSEVKHVPNDTTCQRIILKDLNIKNNTHSAGVSCIRLEDSIGVKILVYAEGVITMCSGLANYGGSPGGGIRVDTPIPSTITGTGTLVLVPLAPPDSFRPQTRVGLIVVCTNSNCTIDVDSISTVQSGYPGILWGTKSNITIHTSKYGNNILYSSMERATGGTCVVVDADSCASLNGSLDSLLVYRGNINSITGFDYVVIGVDSNPNIHIKSIGTLAPNYTKVYSGKIDRYYSNRWTSSRLDLHGGIMSNVLLGTVAKQPSDTIFHMTGGALFLDKGDLSVMDGCKGRIVIDGGSLKTSTNSLSSSSCSGIEVYNHIGNLYLNHGDISIPATNPVHLFLKNSELDTIFMAGKAIVNHGANMILRTLDTCIYFDSISSIQQIVSNFNDATWRKQNYIPLLKASNSSTDDSLYVIDSEGKNEFTLPYSVFEEQYDTWDIYPAYKRIIHYQVGEGTVPKDTIYQEGLVRYITTLSTRTDYDFMGWYADSLCTIRVDSLNEWSRGDTTLWAKWELIPERLTYETMGVKLANQGDLRTRYSEQQQFAIPDALPEQAFYTFHGWHVDSLTGPIVSHTTDVPLSDMEYHILYGDFTREIPSLSIMIAQESCLAVRNPEGLSELESAHYTWVHQDTIVVNGVDSIISDTLPSHKMYVEVGSPIPKGLYTSIIHVDNGYPIYVTRYIPLNVSPSSPRNSDIHTLFYIGSYMLEVDDKGNKYLIMP